MGAYDYYTWHTDELGRRVPILKVAKDGTVTIPDECGWTRQDYALALHHEMEAHATSRKTLKEIIKLADTDYD